MLYQLLQPLPSTLLAHYNLGLTSAIILRIMVSTCCHNLHSHTVARHCQRLSSIAFWLLFRLHTGPGECAHG
jgi:hypothetical protein